MAKKYSVIVFDLGNVQIPFDYSIVAKKLNEIEKDLGTKFTNFYQNNYAVHRSFERGDISEEEFIKTMLDSIDNKIDAETFYKIYSDIFKVNEDVVSLLPKLKEKYMLVLLSNTNSVHKKYGWGKYDFLKIYDKLILSHEANSVKPEEKIYRAVEAFTKKPSDEHFFIDDIPEYVKAAKKIGWDAVQFTNYEQLVADLKKRNIL
ncbi:MAG: HAD family phosphatase [Ignavibacteriaceae bacterium]